MAYPMRHVEKRERRPWSKDHVSVPVIRFETSSNEKGMEKMNIDKLREKFKFDLIGKWISYDGSFSNVMNETWIFYSSGKGITISDSGMSGKSQDAFLWRKKGLFSIEIAYPEDDGSTDWIEISYAFCKVNTDCGAINALVQIDNEGNPGKGFGSMDVPLLYDGASD